MSKLRLKIIVLFVFISLPLIHAINSSSRNAQINPHERIILESAGIRTAGPKESENAGGYDPRYSLLTDPLLAWNTFLGSGGEDTGVAIAMDASGNIYVAGTSIWPWGSPVNPHAGCKDVFVAKLSSSGILQWNTFLGGPNPDQANAIAVDASGNVYVAGNIYGKYDFVAKLDTNGNLQWNTPLDSGFMYSNCSGLAVDTSGYIYLAGTSSATWGSPVNPHSGGSDAFAAKLNSSGVLQWNTFLGSPSGDYSLGIATDMNGNIYICGGSEASWGSPVNPHAGNVFAAKLNNSGAMQWNTFLGSASGGDYSLGIAADMSGNVYLVGRSQATWGSPVNPYAGGWDAFAAKLDNNGALQWNTFLGTWDYDQGMGVSVDAGGNVYISGELQYAQVAKLDVDGVLKWNIFLCGWNDPGEGIAMDQQGKNVYIVGWSCTTWGSPVRPYSGACDAFVAKIVEKDDFVATWDGTGVYYRNSDTGKWIKLSSPANLIAAGDLGSDGIDDLIAVFPSAAGVWTRSSSTGTWAKLSTTTAKHISTGDMNGDARVDLLATWDGTGVYYRNSVSGAWTKIGQPANLVAAGDLDGDNKDDPIMIFPTPAGVWVKYSKTGTWTKLSSTSARDIASGDMNGDGRDDLVGTWDGTGVYYRNSISGIWVKMAIPADQVTAGDTDGDGTDDLIASWASPPGVYTKSSKTGLWTKLGNPVKDMAAGVMRGGIWGSSRFGFIPLDRPLGGYAENPIILSGYEDLSSQGPGGWRFATQEEENLIPWETAEALASPGPGDPGFTCIEQDRLFPQEEGKKVTREENGRKNETRRYPIKSKKQ